MKSNEVSFSITVPIEKSDRTDGWYITGIAAGTEPDMENDSLTPQAIQKLAEQINAGTIPFRNQHNVNTITEDLGYLTKAEVTEYNQLAVEVLLDQDNPEAVYLWNKINKGKKFGMSINGSSAGFYVSRSKEGKAVRNHPLVLLGEVSATTRPIYVPSLGTVLRKAIDLAAGDNNTMPPQVDGQETEVATSAPENVVPTELRPSDELVKSLMANNDFVTLIKSSVAEQLKAVEPQPVVEDTTDSSSEAETSQEQAEPNVEQIVKSALAEVSAQFTSEIQRLAEMIPEVSQPGVLTKSEQENDREIMAEIMSDPRSALRAALAARHGELDKLR